MKGKLYQKILAGTLASVVTFTSCDWSNYTAWAQETQISVENALPTEIQADDLAQESYSSQSSEAEEAPTAEQIGDMKETELQDFLSEMERVEVEGERTLNSTTFVYENGYKEIEFYAEDVRYLDGDGIMVDYDASLTGIMEDETPLGESLEGYLYENTAGDMKAYIPESLEDAPLILENGIYSMKIAPKYTGEESDELRTIIDGAKAVTRIQNEISGLAEGACFAFVNGYAVSALEAKDTVLEEPEILCGQVEDLYGQTQEKATSVVYPSSDGSYALEYISQKSGVKENIILNEIPLANVWEFELTLSEGLYAQKDELTETVSIYDEENDILVAGIEAPYMNDATGENYSEAICYEIGLTDPQTNTYTLTMTVDAEYLATAAYPVTIDPTYSWTCTTNLHDVYVYAGQYADTNFYSSGVTGMYIGCSTAGAIRTYISFDGLSSAVSGKSVISATLSMTEAANSTAGMTVQAFRVTSGYTKTTLTWNNKPSYNTAVLGSLTSSGTGGTVKTIGLTSFVRNVANGSANYGILLKATSESITGNKAVFFGSRASANTPKLTVMYTDKPTKAEVTLDKAYIKQGEALTVNWSGIESISLYQIQYRIAEYDIEGKTAGSTVVAYTRLANGAESGSASVSTSALPEGEYAIYVRGVDAYTATGTGAGKCFVIDSTLPVFSGFSYTSSSAAAYSKTVPTVTWNVTEAYFSSIQYRVNNGSWYTLSTAKSGSAAIPAARFSGAGSYSISVRACDKSGNVSAAKPFTYYYDTEAPSLTMSLSPSGSGSTDRPVISWTALDTSLKAISYRIGNGSYTQISTADTGSYTIPAGKLTEGSNTIYLKAADQAGNETVVSKTYLYDPLAPELGQVCYDPKQQEIQFYVNNATVTSGMVGGIMYGIRESGEEAITERASLKTCAGGLTATGNTMETEEGRWIEYKIKLSAISSLEDGIYDLYFAVPDRVGNYSQIQALRIYRFADAVYDASLSLSIRQEENASGGTICLEMEESDDLTEISAYRMMNSSGFVCIANSLLPEDVTVTDEDGSSRICITDELDTASILSDPEAAVSYRIMAVYESGEAKLSDIVSIRFSEAEEASAEEENSDGETENEDTQPVAEMFFTSLDSDEDGLEDGYELWDLGTDPYHTDSDGDGFCDGYEVFVMGTDPAVYTEDCDSDGDGLTNLEEQETGTHPYLADSDFDGISDSEDGAPLKTDTDGMNPQYSVSVPMGLYDLEQTEEDEDGNSYSYVFNIYSGAVSRYTYADGSITLNWYDRQFRQTAVQTYADGVWYANTYTYDEDGSLTYLTHNGFGYSFFYNENSELASVRVGDRVLKRNIYETVTIPEHAEDGEIVEAYETEILHGITYGNGAGYRYVYDPLYENIRKVYYNDQLLYEMTYDEDGNLITEQDYVNGVTFTYSYDGEGSLTEVSADSGFSITYDYDDTQAAGEDGESDEAEPGVPSVSVTTYHYNGISRIYTTTVEENEETGISSTRTEYWDDLVSEYLFNEDTDTVSYTVTVNGTAVYTKITVSEDQKDTVSYQSGSTEVYDYDSNGNIVSITKDGTLLYSYEYDTLGELTRENDAVSGRTRLYNYDAGGNILSVKTYAYTIGTVSGTPLSEDSYAYTDSTWKDLLTAYNGQTISYDEIGNPLVYRDGMSFGWKYGRSLSTVTIADADSGESEEIGYEYDRSGIRTKKTVNGITTTYALEGYHIRFEETEGSVTEYLYDGAGNLTGFIRGNVTYLYQTNLQGDITAILDLNGNILATYTYDAWGNITGITGNQMLAESNPFRYRGYYYDSETGFYYLNSRYYDPQTGRFLNADEMEYLGVSGTAIGYNLYAYCENNPVNKSDPIGNKAINITAKLVAVMYINALYLYALARIYRWAGFIGKLALLNKFYNLVKTGGKWDLKNQSKWKLKSGDYYTFMGIKLRSDDIGNIHFGFVGSILFSWTTLCLGAGIYQIYSGRSDWKFWYTFFDDPRDTLCISLGRAMWRIAFGRWVFQW